MFLFAKPQEKTIDKSPVKRDTLVSDYLVRIEKDISNYQALYLYTGRLQNQALKNMHRQALIDTFEGVISKTGGETFGMANDDFVVIFNKNSYDEIQACLVKIRFLFQDDPVLRGFIDMEQAKLAKFFDLVFDGDELRKAVNLAMKDFGGEVEPKPEVKGVSSSSGGFFPDTVRKPRVDLTPIMLSKVQKALVQTDFASLIRRQAVCAVIGKSPPQMLFEEVYVSIADLRDVLLPDVDLTANPWLFQHLTETLDKRVLASISQHDDDSLKGNFSLNLNVSTILSDEFLAFDEGVSSSMRSSIVLELQLVDILSDIEAFTLAKTFAQYRGYKICIDTVTVDRLEYINREEFSSDLIKIVWNPSFMDMIRENKYFKEYMDKAERSKMVLCRVDDSQAIEVGNSLGISLYQGRLIQKMLSSQPKKTVYAMR